MREIEPPLELVDLARQGERIAGVAREHLDRDRAAFRRTPQAVDDLQFAALAVAIVAELCQRAAAPLEVARGDVVEHQRAILEMTFGKRGFDLRLPIEQPVQRGIEFVLVNLLETEHYAQ